MLKRNEILVTYGKDIPKMVEEVLEAADIISEIPKGASIGIKPNLVVAKKSSSGATTTPSIVEALIAYLKRHGQENIAILEGSWIGDDTARAFRVCGYEEISKRYHVPLIDTKKDAYEILNYNGLTMEVSKQVLAVDYFINMPVLKGHCQTKITGALKNMKGCISDASKRAFHTWGLHKPIAYLNQLLPVQFILGDGICGDLDFEEGGNPVEMNRIFAGKDPVLVDAYIANTVGYAPEEIAYIKIAEEIGVGSSDIGHATVKTITKDTTKANPASSRRVQQYAKYIAEKDACSACYANLIQALARLDEQGKPSHIKEKIKIGQGYREKTGEGLGIGVCARGMARCTVGCPPETREILAFLSENL